MSAKRLSSSDSTPPTARYENGKKPRSNDRTHWCAFVRLVLYVAHQPPYPICRCPFGSQACRAVAPHYYRMARQHSGPQSEPQQPQHGGGDRCGMVKFVDVPVSDRNAALHQGLGIPTLPYLHCYHPHAGLVEEHRFTRRDVKAVEHLLRCYVTGSCPLASALGDADAASDGTAATTTTPGGRYEEDNYSFNDNAW
jgi:hypothetical protein